MLCSFSVENFKAFRKAVTIDFSSTGNYAFNQDAIKNGISKTALMYGTNACGKTSLCLALFDIVKNLTDKFFPLAKYSVYQNAFRLDKPVSFEYKFIFDGIYAVYSYKKSDVNTIIAESLSIDDKAVFSYDRSVAEQTSQMLQIKLKGAESLNIKLNDLKISLFRFVKNNTNLEDNPLNRVFNNIFCFVDRMLLFWSNEDRGFVGYGTNPSENMINYIIKSGNFDSLKKLFKEAGYDDQLEYEKDDLNYKINVVCGNNKIDFSSVASNGMKALLLFYFWLENSKKEDIGPSFICIDEFDAFYHFELSNFLVKRLKELDCQVFLTSHNTYNFSNELLRPDCYYICSKERVINAHNATDKELRLGHNLEKLYRGGAFGL